MIMAANLRVIAGQAKGRRLASVPGDSTRPITDRAKESLFNILATEIPGTYFLDLFGGTGAVGIEALSRGADWVRFIEKNPRAVDTIQKNLATCQFEELADVQKKDAFTLLGQRPDEQFDFIYVAPPQWKQLWVKAIQALDANPGWVMDDGWVIVQIAPSEYQKLHLSNFAEFDERKYGSTLLVFYERMASDDE
jgi:16S rRNA (guanine(966)-N(2))-methyltransferase RsmD